MAIHTVRDYLVQNVSTSSKQWVAGYLLGIFLRRVLGYTYVGDTNYPLNTVGTLLIATPDSTPTAATPTFAVGTRAGINQGSGREFYVWVPPSVRAVALADVGRLLVLKSTANSTSNSGVYNITGFEALNLSVQTTTGNGVSPITVTTTTTNTLTTGQTVLISSVTGNTNANGTWTITVLNGTQFTVNATGNGTYGGGGTVVTNSYVIDYRSMGQAGLPPQEPFDSMNWYLYAADSLAPVSGLPNSTYPANYGGNGNSTTPRIVMQSPHSLGWQVRLCHETLADYANNIGVNQQGNVPVMTASPGFGGNISGDFAVAGPHLHTAQYYFNYTANTTTLIAGNTPGFGEASAIIGGSGFFPVQYRITIVGDDTGQGVAMFARRQFDASSPKSYLIAFGLPENEPLPLPTNNTARLFFYGSGLSNNNSNDYGNSLNNVGWSPGNVFASNGSTPDSNLGQGVSQSQGGIPCSSVPSIWTYSFGSSQFGSPIFDGSASDSPWLNGTELFPVDIVNGTVATFSGYSSVSQTLFPLEPRIIGTIPHLRAGRSNFGEYALTTDAGHVFQHMRNGVYVTWNGPQVIP